jgi:type I restriction enzyme S subunit
MNLPEGWLVTAVGKVLIDIQPGFAQRPGDENEGITTPQIRTHNIGREGNITLDGIKHVIASAKELERYQLNVGDVVFNNTNSEEWVGKTAVFDKEGEYVFSNHMTRLRVDTSLIIPEFLARYLHLLWEKGYSKTRAKRWVSQAAIDATTLISFKLPLPTLSEQQCIIDVMRKSDEVTAVKRSISDQIDHLVKTSYWEHFGEWYTTNGLRDSVRISEYMADSQYGVSEAMEESGSHAILRMNSISTNGWLDLSDLKYANLSKRDAENTQLQDGDLLFNRTNSKDLVGKCGIWRGARVNFSFASYLVRLRLKKGMLPEYLWATLNSTYGKYRLLNAAKQAVSMANVSPTDLGRITVPLPPLKLQEKYAKLVRHIETLRAEMLSKTARYDELQALVTQQALLGELTAAWREQHKQQILAESKKRNETLNQLGIRTHATVVNIPEPVIYTKHTREQTRSARVWLIDELSEFQRNVLNAFTAYGQTIFTEDPDRFAEFCSHVSLTECLDNFSPNQIGRTISLLADVGLIAQVSLPANNSLTQQQEFVKAFRPLREEEYAKLADLETLRRSLSGSSQKEHHFFTVTLDYEASARAGAAGMFQVISITDTDDNDRTNLVDQGTHYASLEELASDIAEALDVEVAQVELEIDGEVSE